MNPKSQFQPKTFWTRVYIFRQVQNRSYGAFVLRHATVKLHFMESQEQRMLGLGICTNEPHLRPPMRHILQLYGNPSNISPQSLAAGASEMGEMG